MKHRAVTKLIKSLPKSPKKRTEVVSAYLPTVKTLVKQKKVPSLELSENKIKKIKTPPPHPNQTQVMQAQIMKKKKMKKKS